MLLFLFVLQMSKREDLKDTLLEELANLDVFDCLVHYTSARGQLLRIVAALMASNKPLPRRLSDAYVGRFGLPQVPQTETAAEAEADNKQTEQAAESGDQFKCEQNEQNNIASNHNNHKSPTQAQAQEQDVAEQSELEPLSPQEVHAIDLGLRLGSFLSEAGWMQESISVLSCLNERLKQLKPFKNQLVTRLDCLQRYLDLLKTLKTDEFSFTFIFYFISFTRLLIESSFPFINLINI